jgi:hypothetical protein
VFISHIVFEVIMEPVGIAEIAEIANVTGQAVSNWYARDASFPKPIAALACGVIWDRDQIIEWLSANRKLPVSGNQSVTHQFKKGQFYAHNEINDVFGGNPNTYLRLRAGRITCGCFNVALNPNAPIEILVGIGPQIERSAEILIKQEGAIPVFVKRGVNQWQYQGMMLPIGLDKSLSVIARMSVEAGRNDVSAILMFASVED